MENQTLVQQKNYGRLRQSKMLRRPQVPIAFPADQLLTLDRSHQPSGASNIRIGSTKSKSKFKLKHIMLAIRVIFYGALVVIAGLIYTDCENTASTNPLGSLVCGTVTTIFMTIKNLIPLDVTLLKLIFTLAVVIFIFVFRLIAWKRHANEMAQARVELVHAINMKQQQKLQGESMMNFMQTMIRASQENLNTMNRMPVPPPRKRDPSISSLDEGNLYDSVAPGPVIQTPSGNNQ